jgi:hypothetical protein
MARKPERKPDDPEQSKRFIDAAKEAGADETEPGADRAFKKVVKPGAPIRKGALRDGA